jgi:TonB-dependent receptor
MSGWILRACAAACCLLAASLSIADEPPPTDIGRVSKGAQGVPDESVVKPSATRDRAAAIEEKKQAPNLIEVQPLSEMLKLPDVNLAEALQRMPGISLETDTGEGRFVNIRGMDSDLNGTTYGGVRLPPSNPSSPFGGGRATAFDVIPTGLVGGVELTKTNRPDLDAEALGGTINLVPRSGDSNGGKPFTEVTLGGGYEKLRGTPVYDFGVTTGRSFARDGDGLFSGANAFSALVTAVYHQDKRGIDDVEAAYSDNQSQGVPDKLLNTIDFRRYQYKRETYGLAGNFDAKANELNSFYLRLMWSGYLELKEDHHLTIGNMDSGCVPSDGGDPANCAASSAYPNGFTSPSASFDENLTDSSERIDNQLAVLGGKSVIGGAQFDYHISLAQGRDIVYYNYGSDFSLLNNGNSAAIAYDNNSNPNYPNYRTTDGTNATNPANYALSDLSVSSSTDRDREWGGALDATLPLTVWDNPADLKVGLSARLRRKTHQEVDGDFSPAGSNPILLSDYSGGPDQTFYNGIYNVGPALNLLAIRALTGGSPLLQNNGDDIMGAEQAYEDDNENVFAGYVQFTAKVDRFGLFTGLRVEKTDATYRAFGFTTDINGNTSNLGLQARSNSYTNYFPTVQGRFSFTDQLIGRLTYSTGIARPGFDQITASTIIVADSGGASVTIGNPNLKPTTGNNIDMTLEYYPAAGAVASLGIFAKEFSDYILPTVVNETNYPGVNGIAQVSTFSNGSAHAYGAEGAFVDQFQFLPQPLDGLGVSANVTVVDSQAEIHPGVFGLLPSTSKLTWNAAAFYEKGPIEARIAAGFVGQNLFGFGSTGDSSTDIYSRHRLTLDFGTSYKIANLGSIYFEAKNLLNTPLEFTEGPSDSRPIQREFYDLTLLAGLRAKF